MANILTAGNQRLLGGASTVGIVEMLVGERGVLLVKALDARGDPRNLTGATTPPVVARRYLAEVNEVGRVVELAPTTMPAHPSPQWALADPVQGYLHLELTTYFSANPPVGAEPVPAVVAWPSVVTDDGQAVMLRIVMLLRRGSGSFRPQDVLTLPLARNPGIALDWAFDLPEL